MINSRTLVRTYNKHFTSCRRISTAKLPVIKLDTSNTATQIKNALEIYGFFYVKLPESSIGITQNALAKCKWFFLDTSAEYKRSCESIHGKGYYMYHGLGTSESPSSDIEAFLISNPTCKEPFDLKKEYFAASQKDLSIQEIQRDYNKTQSNRWPRGNSTLDKEFKTTIKEFYQNCQSLTNVILQQIAISLELPHDYFTRIHDKFDNTFELKHYIPKQPIAKNPVIDHFERLKRMKQVERNTSMDNDVDNDGSVIRVKSHADLSSITLLFQNDVDGLQVLSPNGEWINAVPIDNTVLVNSGNFMSMYTNNLFKSTKHRVIQTEMNEKRSRFTMVYFAVPNWETEIKLIPSIKTMNKPHDERILAGDLIPFI